LGHTINEPLITIIVPVYNVERYLSRCIESIQRQTYRNWELFLVDDGSLDSSGSICDSYANNDKRIHVIHQKNQGVSIARNVALDRARGEYIQFIDADDWEPEDALLYLYDLLNKEKADFCMAQYRLTRNQDVFLVNDTRLYSSDITEGYMTCTEFLDKFFRVHTQEQVQYLWGKLFKADLFRDVRFIKGVASGEDIAGLFPVILQSKRIAYSSKIVYNYFVNQSGATKTDFNSTTFDPILAWDNVVQNAERYGDKDILRLAKLNKKRAEFAILCTLAISKRFDYNYQRFGKEINRLLYNLKKNRRELLHAPIPFSRKVLVVLFCSSYYTTAKLIQGILHFGIQPRKDA
jgi:glycosyltransferase involved in cell wall biosynthesis